MLGDRRVCPGVVKTAFPDQTQTPISLLLPRWRRGFPESPAKSSPQSPSPATATARCQKAWLSRSQCWKRFQPLGILHLRGIGLASASSPASRPHGNHSWTTSRAKSLTLSCNVSLIWGDAREIACASPEFCTAPSNTPRASTGMWLDQRCGRVRPQQCPDDFGSIR